MKVVVPSPKVVSLCDRRRERDEREARAKLYSDPRRWLHLNPRPPEPPRAA